MTDPRPYRNAAWLLMLPAALLMGTVGVMPLFAVFNYALHDIFSLSDVLWVGPEWYAELVADPRFHASLLRSLAFSATVIAVQVPLGVALALMLRGMRGAVFVLMLVALPLVVPW